MSIFLYILCPKIWNSHYQKIEEMLGVHNTSNMEPWSHILASVTVECDRGVEITAEQIKKCKESWTGPQNQFEPRLLAYQTSDEGRPAIFKTRGLYILPITNGSYMLTKIPIYRSLEYPTLISGVSIQKDTTSEILNIGTSETSVIDNLRYSGVFERPELLGEPITHGPLLNGRHRCTFDMKLGEHALHISGVQYETDACFESAHKVLIIEGKSSGKPIGSFNIRQLYFPYRVIHQRIGAKKEIIPIFIHDYKGEIHIWKYSFPEADRMDSIRLEAQYVYKFEG